jgi:hypothetical protein
MTEKYLYKLTIKTFLIHQDKEHEYVFYLGVDDDDAIFNNPTEQKALLNLKRVFKNIDFRFIVLNEKKGYLTKMWNKLFREAYREECDYFYQCGDDIEFKTDGWVNDCINTLIQNRGIGLTGPINNNNFILTQAFVSRLHMDIFGFFFPENIINWGCDDWYNWVYKPKYFFPLNHHYCSNEGGSPRYAINNNSTFMKNYKYNVDKLRKSSKELAESHRYKLINYLK